MQKKQTSKFFIPKYKYNLPKDLGSELNKVVRIKKQWKELTAIARRDFITWVNLAKQESTRKHRIKRTLQLLSSGKKRPCCFSFVPLELYSDLNKNKNAKLNWKSLTSDERRNIVDWIYSVNHKNSREKRVGTAFKMLSSS